MSKLVADAHALFTMNPNNTGQIYIALLKFDLKRRKTDADKIESFQQVTRRLAGCKQMIKDSPWAGLAELTQKNGEHCPDSVSLSPVLVGNLTVAHAPILPFSQNRTLCAI